MNKIKKAILCPIFCSSVLFSSNITEYTVGLNDKLGYFGPFTKSWIKEKSVDPPNPTTCVATSCSIWLMCTQMCHDFGTKAKFIDLQT